MKTKESGSSKFNSYYSKIYGIEWEELKNNLLKDTNPVLLDNLNSEYFMDRASVIAANVLPVKKGNTVLDMCAAPGGKTLVIALKLDGTGSLTSNDRSAERRSRLKKVIENCLSSEKRKNITVTSHDSTKWNLYEKDKYDCILLDAPCSSERHVLKDNNELSNWGLHRPKILAINSFAMLASALDAVKVNGYILYSTCSINPGENQDNIEKLNKKRNGKFEEVKEFYPQDIGKSLSYGKIILPDNENNMGPLYFCLLRRIK